MARLSRLKPICSVTEFSGQPAIIATVNDISDRRRAEDQLRQAQKMEAIGRLAGGIAHDFNNLLTAIRGNAELLSYRLGATRRCRGGRRDPAGRRSSRVDDAAAARVQPQADRAGPARHQRRNGVVARMARRLHRSEDVKLHFHLAGSGCPVMADPAQVEQLLLNLVVNARDALPEGGTITVAPPTATCTSVRPRSRARALLRALTCCSP